jgi:hypothetical protein
MSRGEVATVPSGGTSVKRWIDKVRSVTSVAVGAQELSPIL